MLDRWSDPRVDQMKLEWFRDKKVLDIGCNNGTVDLLIAAKCMPKLIIGVDIDPKLISNAIKNMQNAINDQEQMEIIFEQMKKEYEERENTEMQDAYELQVEQEIKAKEEKLKALL